MLTLKLNSLIVLDFWMSQVIFNLFTGKVWQLLKLSCEYDERDHSNHLILFCLQEIDFKLSPERQWNLLIRFGTTYMDMMKKWRCFRYLSRLDQKIIDRVLWWISWVENMTIGKELQHSHSIYCSTGLVKICFVLAPTADPAQPI